MNKFILDGISVAYTASEGEVTSRAESRLKGMGISPRDCEVSIFHRSVDARHKDDIKFVYSVSVITNNENAKRLLLQHGARELHEEALEIQKGTESFDSPPLIVGMGPAGLFCAYLLASEGYCPIIIDRGDDVVKRAQAVEKFYSSGALDTNSNIQFGAGGAGTFSDGKLLTRINDPKCSYVLNTLHKFGAPDDILVKAKPHVGTDKLRIVVGNMLSEIEKLGGKVIYRCRLNGISERDNGEITAYTTCGEIKCSSIVLALGHSARDTYRTLIESGYDIIPKPISVGVRIEHRREDIEKALYGNFAGDERLGAAEYALSDTKGARGVYTFCMCPGGEVVAAASEENGIVVNGMSHYSRDGINSNCAVAVSVGVENFESIDGSPALGAIEFQRQIERAAFKVGGGNYNAPIQTVGDFMSFHSGTEPSRVMPTYMGGNKYKVSNLERVLPNFVCESLRYGLSSFDKKIKGFASPNAVLSAPETRTSAPLRILRGEDMIALGRKSVYPCGEGAGYAGGITSAGVDGIKTAIAIMRRFAPTR